MADPTGLGTDTAVISDALTAARELLRSAEDDAARLRADVDRYVRQREQEAELIVAKARRLLAMAEARAASMDAGSASEVVDLASPERTSSAPAAEAEPRPVPTGIDGILASAIAKAFDQSFPG